LTAFGFVVLACVILTIFVGVTASKRKQASRALTHLIESAHEANEPQAIVDALEHYLQTPRAEKLADRARAELSQARAEIDRRDYQAALTLEHGTHTDLDRLEAALQSYLDKQPNGDRRLDVTERLALIPIRRDDRAFARAQADARAAEGDFGLLEGAWQAYLDEYPHGDHEKQARVEIALIPDKHDESMLVAALAEADELCDAGRLTEGLLRLDLALTEVLSPLRIERIQRRAREIETRLASIDAEKCLAPMPENAAARAVMTASCRLYLLCYPHGAEREKVERRLRDIQKLAREELLAELRVKLSDLKDEPLAALWALNEFGALPGAGEVDLADEQVHFHMMMLSRSVAESLKNMKLITLADGAEFIGAVVRVSNGWIQIKPRAVGDKEPPKGRLVRDTEVTVIQPPLLEQLERLQEVVSGGPASEAAEAIRVARQAAQNDAYRPEWLAFQVCLAGLDPDDDEARQALSAADYVEHNGVFVPVADMTALGGADAQSPLQRKLAFYVAYCETAAPKEKMLALTPNSFEHSFLGATLKAPIDWELEDPECHPTLLSGAQDHFRAELKYVYPTIARRSPEAALPPSVISELDEELATISRDTRITMTCEVRAAVQHLNSVGFDTRGRDADLVVNRVFADGAAAVAGILPGDRVVTVDGVALDAEATDDTLAVMIANSAGTSVVLTFLREGRRFRVVLERRPCVVEKFQMRRNITAVGSLIIQAELENEVSEWIDVPAPS